MTPYNPHEHMCCVRFKDPLALAARKQQFILMGRRWIYLEDWIPLRAIQMITGHFGLCAAKKPQPEGDFSIRRNSWQIGASAPPIFVPISTPSRSLGGIFKEASALNLTSLPLCSGPKWEDQVVSDISRGRLRYMVAIYKQNAHCSRQESRCTEVSR